MGGGSPFEAVETVTIVAESIDAMYPFARWRRRNSAVASFVFVPFDAVLGSFIATPAQQIKTINPTMHAKQNSP